ncbi:TPA: hypothetical protein NU789_001740 [Acinetobacter baumannii]|uniref:DUF7167 family protein n=1 Tax=Acinetobacter calcoaceticus/baumannii complex TaxID=909768 RepID=UPI000B53B565|nr:MULTISPECIES: hypothetical protein [Acinetobacter calcoaceticus/baumannii complex]ELB1968700.1 hypothetical protein [Acinetobacter baumannii]ELB1972175.1 hypothetical protein [Acinetobacter baumannii]MBJ8460501.1 hypothetical protein [Acinetobacter nosocomialis]MBU3138429.1 hypothetical protein [Acinetobacter nosocomialis]MBZ6528830.1 hypothetical protein [Acinetobacter nosocomialis]
MSEFNSIKVRLKLSIGFVIGNQEEDVLLSDYISEDEWNALGFFEKQEFVEKEILNEWANEYIEKCAEVLE